MSVLHQLQPSFNNGEISPLLYDRTDYQKFTSSVKSGKNMFVHPQGGMSNRAGTMMLGNAKDDYVRLIPFEFSNTETYMIEFGNGYCRFYTTNGQVVTEDGTHYEISSPFSTSDLDKIRYVQSGDVMYLAWGGKPQTLTRYGHTNWVFSEYNFSNGPFDTNAEYKGNLTYQEVSSTEYLVFFNSSDYNFNNNDIGRLLRVKTKINSQTFSGAIKDEADKSLYGQEKFFVVNEYNLNTTGTWNGSFKILLSKDGINWEEYNTYTSTNGSANYDIANDLSGDARHFLKFDFSNISPSSTGLSFSFRSNSGEFYIDSKIVSIINPLKVEVSLSEGLTYKIIDYISSSNTNFILWNVPALTSNTSSAEISIYGSASDLSNAYKLLDNNSSTSMNMPGGEVSNVVFTFLNKVYFSSVTLHLVGKYNSGSLVKYGTMKVGLSILVNYTWKWCGYFRDQSSANGSYTVDTNTSDNIQAIRIEIINDDSRGGVCYGMTINNPRTVEGGVVPINYPSYLGIWSDTTSYPTEVELYQDRIEWFTNNKTDATKISDYTNFGVSTEVTDDDAISVIIKDKKINKINSAIAGSKLVVFTDSGNFIHNNDTFTPNSATFLKQGSTGGADVKPIVVRDNIIYAHPMKQAISDYAYSFETDGYAGQDITILANHLFENKKIKTLAYQQEPYSIIWVLQEEGSVLACTYLRQQDVIAWTPMDFGGKVLSIGVLSNGSNEELYLAVKRKNGTFVEKMPTRLPNADPKERFFVDCGRTYCGTPANVISGLDYLEGEKVVALADGNVVKDLVVANGQITLQTPASVVNVGLPYESVLETLTFDVNAGDGSQKNRKKRVVAVSVRYNNSRGTKISVNGHREVDMLKREMEGYNDPISLKSGFYREILPSAHKEPTTIKIRQDEPLPVTIVSIIPELEYEQ